MKKTILLCCLICSVYGCKKDTAYPKTTLPGTLWRHGPVTFLSFTNYLFIEFVDDTTVITTVADAGGLKGLNSLSDTLRCVIHIDSKRHQDSFEVYLADGTVAEGSTTADANQIIYRHSNYYRF